MDDRIFRARRTYDRTSRDDRPQRMRERDDTRALQLFDTDPETMKRLKAKFILYVKHHKGQFLIQLVLMLTALICVIVAYTDKKLFDQKVHPGTVLATVVGLAYFAVSMQGIQRWCDSRGANCVATTTMLMHLVNIATGGFFGAVLFFFVPLNTRDREYLVDKRAEAQYARDDVRLAPRGGGMYRN